MLARLLQNEVNVKAVEDAISSALSSSVTSLSVPARGGYPRYIAADGRPVAGFTVRALVTLLIYCIVLLRS